MKIVIAEPVTKNLNELIIGNQLDWVVYDDAPKNKEELIDRLKDAEATSSYSIKYDREIFEACPKLKFLAIPAVGANYFVDMDDARKHGVTVMNCPGYNSIAVAEMAIGAAIAVSRMIPLMQKDLRNGLWADSSRGHRLLLTGKKIGIIGHGNVARSIEKYLKNWSVSIDFIDSKSSEKDIDDLVAISDVIFVCIPATDETYKIVSAERIASMKPTSLLVNVGRGAVVDEDALYEALKNHKIHGAGLDVFNEEPEYGNDTPASIRRFIELDNAYITPHLAGSSRESSDVLGQMIFDNLVSTTKGSPINVYN